MNVRSRGLGTIITSNPATSPAISRAGVANFCQEIGGGQVCCKFMGGGAGTACPGGMGPVSQDYQFVTLEVTQPGYARIIAGPPREALSEEFAMPGMTKPKKAPSKAPPKTPPSPYDPYASDYPPIPQYDDGGAPQSDLASVMNQYSSVIGIASAALILGLVLTGNRK